MTKKASPEKHAEEARKILKRVEQESETLGTSSMRRTAENISSHMRADDTDQEDWAEIWGTRIGRILSVVFFCALVIYLVNTYVLQ